MEKRLLRDNPDIPKEDRDPDVILGRMEHFWRGHGVKGVTMPDDRFSSKEFGFYHGGKQGDQASRIDIGFEGGLTSVQARKLDIHTAYDGLNIHDFEDEGFKDWLYNKSEYKSGSARPPEAPMYYLADTLRPVGIVRHNSDDAITPWQDHESMVKDRLTHFKEIAEEYSTNHKKVTDFINNLPNEAPGYKETLKVGDTSPHYLGGQFARVEYVPRTPGRDSYTWGHLVSGGDVHNDVIDLRTGSWARISKDQRGTEEWNHPRFDT